MDIGSPPWMDLLAQGVHGMGLEPQTPLLEKCARLSRLLIAANRRVNLTSITDPREVALKHLIDSLAPLAHVPDGARTADLGSGAGFPGLIMALFRPDIRLASVEPVRKKTSFQRHAALDLGLTNVKIYNIRAENWTREGEADVFFDVVASRAAAKIGVILDWAAPMLARHGRVIAMKGREDAEPLDALGPLVRGGTAFESRAIPYSLPGEDAARRLVILTALPAPPRP